MRHSIKTTMMVLVAMFAFSTAADAQFSINLNKARKALGIKTKKEKKEEAAAKEAQRKRDSVQAVINSITPTIPQPDKKGKPVTIKWMNNKVGEWDPAALKLTFDQTYQEGEYAGQHVTLTLDPATGKWTSISGKEVGQMSNDGTLETPNLGTIKFNPKTNEVSMDGEVIGFATINEASCYGTKFGSFDSYVSPLLVAYTTFGVLISNDQVDKLKAIKQKADAEAAARAAKERELAAARAASSSRVSSSSSNSSSSSSSSSKQSIELYRSGSRFGEIRPNGDIYISGSRVGEARSNGDIYVNGSNRGEVRSNGDVYKSGRRVGEIRSNGEIYLDGRRVGEVRSNGDVYLDGRCVGNARNMTSSDVKTVAAIYFFNFF
ncbi:MAG: polymer-forming cytoskeletal protein [Prevotella sp.]|nr:polymer-forming cytoskeletal protein [Prevotella sp.]